VLVGRPLGLLTWSYEFRDGGRKVAELRTRAVRDAGELRLADGRELALWREGWFSGRYLIAEGGRMQAFAEKPSPLLRRFVVGFGDRRMLLAPSSALRRDFRLWEGQRGGGPELGALSPASLLSRRMEVDLDPDLPLELRAFCAWLVILMWKRAASASAS